MLTQIQFVLDRAAVRGTLVHSVLYVQHNQPMISGHGRWDKVLQKEEKTCLWLKSTILYCGEHSSLVIFISSSLNIAMLDAGTFKANLSAKCIVLYEPYSMSIQ